MLCVATKRTRTHHTIYEIVAGYPNVSNPVVEIRLNRVHILSIAALILLSSASADIQIKDQMKVFQDLDMEGNAVTNLPDTFAPSDAVDKEYVEENTVDKQYVEENSGGIGNIKTYTDTAYEEGQGASVTAEVCCPQDETPVASASVGDYRAYNGKGNLPALRDRIIEGARGGFNCVSASDSDNPDGTVLGEPEAAYAKVKIACVP